MTWEDDPRRAKALRMEKIGRDALKDFGIDAATADAMNKNAGARILRMMEPMPVRLKLVVADILLALGEDAGVPFSVLFEQVADATEKATAKGSEADGRWVRAVVFDAITESVRMANRAVAAASTAEAVGRKRGGQ